MSQEIYDAVRSRITPVNTADVLSDEEISHAVHMKLAQLEADAHRALQMVGVAGNRLTNMKASHAMAAARKMRDTAALLEKVAKHD